MLPLASFFLHRLRAFVFRLHCRGVEQAACTSSRALSPALVLLMFALAARFRCCKGRRFRRSRGAVRLHECQRIAPCAAVASHTIMQPRHLRELSRMYRILFTRRRNVFSTCQLGILTSSFMKVRVMCQIKSTPFPQHAKNGLGRKAKASCQRPALHSCGRINCFQDQHIFSALFALEALRSKPAAISKTGVFSIFSLRFDVLAARGLWFVIFAVCGS
jgi:hypothetical protein